MTPSGDAYDYVKFAIENFSPEEARSQINANTHLKLDCEEKSFKPASDKEIEEIVNTWAHTIDPNVTADDVIPLLVKALTGKIVKTK